MLAAGQTCREILHFGTDRIGVMGRRRVPNVQLCKSPFFKDTHPWFYDLRDCGEMLPYKEVLRFIMQQRMMYCRILLLQISLVVKTGWPPNVILSTCDVLRGVATIKLHLPQLQIAPGLLVASNLGFIRGDERNVSTS